MTQTSCLAYDLANDWSNIALKHSFDQWNRLIQLYIDKFKPDHSNAPSDAVGGQHIASYTDTNKQTGKLRSARFVMLRCSCQVGSDSSLFFSPYGVGVSGLVTGKVLRLVSAGQVDVLDRYRAGATLISADPAHAEHTKEEERGSYSADKRGTWLTQRKQ